MCHNLCFELLFTFVKIITAQYSSFCLQVCSIPVLLWALKFISINSYLLKCVINYNLCCSMFECINKIYIQLPFTHNSSIVSFSSLHRLDNIFNSSESNTSLKMSLHNFLLTSQVVSVRAGRYLQK